LACAEGPAAESHIIEACTCKVAIQLITGIGGQFGKEISIFRFECAFNAIIFDLFDLAIITIYTD
jgi:hypothetical protein